MTRPCSAAAERDVVVEIRRAVADDRDVLRASVDIQAVHVDVGERLRERHDRIRRVVLRSEQTLLFGRHRREQNGALRRRRELRVRARDLEQAGRARRVVTAPL